MYVAYPLACWLIAKARAPLNFSLRVPDKSYSIIVAAYNEQERIAARVNELIGHMRGVGVPGELIVVSDGSTDSTATIAMAYASENVKVLSLPINQGKANALNCGAAAAQGELLVFADIRQTWDANALSSLLCSFSAPDVGAVGGELVLVGDSGANMGVGLYWRYEKWIRTSESRLSSTIGVSGCIAAVRKSLYVEIPPGIVLDDVYWPMQVVLKRYRVIFNSRAIARDTLPAKSAHEFRRKVRTLAGNYQLAACQPLLLLPWKNPAWWQFVSHKLGRLIVPWAIVLELGACAASGSELLITFFAFQAGAIAAMALPLVLGAERRLGLLSVGASFLLLNAASIAALFVWLSGRTTQSWKKSKY